ncbi:hypothetical protein HZH66_008236 [Vespula vulgaris]|uniref:Peptidase S1 domain-containing protein n=1 Tax=Vespula vulgaris TaxID=7454 RepID=A0A834JVC5_VESVU|nr:hypothetical protein HZH66_008236 [Vespula vulgaris]
MAMLTFGPRMLAHKEHCYSPRYFSPRRKFLDVKYLGTSAVYGNIRIITLLDFSDICTIELLSTPRTRLLVLSQDFNWDYDEGRIVGGQQTSIHQHPYQVSVRFNTRHICGGAIISKEWIITAAHCVKDTFVRYVSIKAGISDLRMREKSFHFGQNMRPISLAKTTDQYTTGSKAVVTGWGVLRKNGVLSDKLREVRVPVLSNRNCSYLYMGREITSRMLCAGYLNVGGRDACQGDSGGPLVQHGKLIGLVSWGYGCAEPAYPGVYTRVAALRSWITEHAGV